MTHVNGCQNMDLLLLGTWIGYAPWLVVMGAAGRVGLLFRQRGGVVLLEPAGAPSAWPRGNHRQRLAAALLADPDRLLTAVLFWNCW